MHAERNPKLRGAGIVRLFLPALALFSLAACAAISPRTQTLGVSTAAAGVAATDAALTNYANLEPLRQDQLLNSNTATLLAVPEPAALDILRRVSSPDAKEQARQARWRAGLKAREEAATDLQEAYRAFNRLSSGKFGDDTTAAFAKASEAAMAFAKARDIPLADSPIPGVVGRGLGELLRYRQARDIKRHNAVLAELSLQFQTLWDADLPWFERAIEGAYKTPLTVSLPNSAFDAAAVAKQVPEPLSTDLKLRLYRMRLLSDSSADVQARKARLRAVAKSLRALQDAHVELAKDAPTLGDVIDYLDRVLELSKEAEGGEGK